MNPGPMDLFVAGKMPTYRGVEFISRLVDKGDFVDPIEDWMFLTEGTVNTFTARNTMSANPVKILIPRVHL